VDTLLGLLVLLAFLSLPAGLISFCILVGKAIARMVNGPTPVDPDPVPVLRRSYTNAILVTLALMGAISFAAMYVIGSGLAVQ
jgi:hypothetical protein